MRSAKTLIIIAGEESGDYYGAELAQTLWQHCPSLAIKGIGGRQMEQAGVEIFSNLAQFGVTGFTEVFRHFRIIYQTFKKIQAILKKTKPDLLLLIDYPGFNLRLAKFAHELNIPIIYYISPQIWAWKANRIKKIQQYITHMAVILPFEKQIYKKNKVNVSFVGHPLIKKIDQFLRSDFKKLTLPVDKKIIALLPGSRVNEIKKILPLMIKAAIMISAKHPNVHFAVSIAGSLDANWVRSFFKNNSLSLSFFENNHLSVIQQSNCVIVTSGTASLEAALLLKPMAIVYKTSWLTCAIARKLLKIRYLGLANILANKMIVPELQQEDCNPTQITTIMQSLLYDNQFTAKQINSLAKIKENLCFEHADTTLVELVQSYLEANDTSNA